MKLKTNVNLEDEATRGIYFHDMAEDSRTLELLLNTCYKLGIKPSAAGRGHGKGTLAYVILELDKDHLNPIGKLMDLTLDIPNCEFNIKTEGNGIFVELSCDSRDDDQLFTRMKEIVEENIIASKQNYNYKIMSTIYNISKIVKEVVDADVLFATNEKLYAQGKCGLSIYQGKQINKINTKKADDVKVVIDMLKSEATLNLPSVFFCTFEELRNFYFELDETVYTKVEGE